MTFGREFYRAYGFALGASILPLSLVGAGMPLPTTIVAIGILATCLFVAARTIEILLRSRRGGTVPPQRAPVGHASPVNDNEEDGGEEDASIDERSLENEFWFHVGRLTGRALPPGHFSNLRREGSWLAAAVSKLRDL